MISSLWRWWSPPIVPLLVINSSLNQQKTANLLKKLAKVNYKQAQALAMVIEIGNHMPVQVDHIADFLEEKRKEFNLKLYGFCHSNVTLGIHVNMQSHTICCQKRTIYIPCLPQYFSSKEVSATSKLRSFSIWQVSESRLENQIQT